MAKLAEAWAPRAALGLTALLLLVLSAEAALLVWSAYRDEVRSAELRAESSAHVVAAHMRWIGEAAFQSLQRVDEALGDQVQVIGEREGRSLGRTLTTLPGDIPVLLIDAGGNFVPTGDAGAAEVNVADRPYFEALRNGAQWYISSMLTERGSRQKVFVIGRRIERGGAFLGAATILVPAELMSQFWSSLDLGPGSAVGLVRDDGWLVARHPIPDAPINLAGHPLFTTYLPRSPAGSYGSGSSPADGFARIVGYRTVDGLPLVATAGISHEAVLDRFWSRIGSAAFIAVPIALALLATTIGVGVLLRRYERQRLDLSRALDQNRMLLLEVHHRVKNNLTTVLALIQMHPLAPESKRELGARIRAMAALHEELYQSDQFGALDLAGYIRRLVDSLRQTVPDSVQVSCQLADVEIDADQALPLGLIVNEVATNSFKHAFPGGRRGTVAITLERIGDDRARLQIRDDGVGFDAERQDGGMGSRLIHGLCQQIRAECVYRSDDGTAFTVDFPLAPRPDEPEARIGEPVTTFRPEASGAAG